MDPSVLIRPRPTISTTYFSRPTSSHVAPVEPGHAAPFSALPSTFRFQLSKPPPSLLKTPNYQSNQEMLHYISSPLRPRFLLLPSSTSNLRFLAMSASPSSSSSRSVRGAAVSVPSLGADDACAMGDEAFRRYTSPSLRRGGVGVAVVWFRNDLRVLDNEALLRAWAASEAVLPVYCVDPRVFAGSTHYFGFPKTGGEDLAILHFARCFCIWDLR